MTRSAVRHETSDASAISAPRTAPVASAAPGAPRFGTLWAALTYALATMTLAWPALAGRFLVNEHSDQYIAGYAFREFAASSIRAGEGVPLWNPYLFGGMPYVAAMHGDIFYPTALLRAVMPTDDAMTWGFIIHVFLAGLFTFLFLRQVGFRYFPSLVGGLAYMMSGNVAGLVSPGHDGKLFISALLPLVLFFLDRAMRGGQPWAWGALSLSVTLAVLTPHPQLFQYLLLLAGAYALYVALRGSGGNSPVDRRTLIGRLALAGAAVVVGTAGGAIQFLPLLEYTAWSPRAGGAGWEHAISYSLPPEELLNFYLPQFSGILDRYSGRNVIHFHSEYVGASVLVLAGLAFGRGAMEGNRGFVWFWTAALVVAVLWALGGFTPFYRLIYAVVPGTKFFRAPSTMLYIVSFAIAVLAAIGCQRAVGRSGVSLRYLVGWVAVAAFVALLAVSGALANLASIVAHPQLLDRVDANAMSIILGALRSLLVVAAVAIVLLLRIRGRLSEAPVAWIICAIITVDLWSVERLYWRFSPSAAALYQTDPIVRYLDGVPQPFRVVPHVLDQLASERRDPYLGSGDGQGTGFMVHDVRSVVGYHGNELDRYAELVGWRRGDWPQRILTSVNLRRLTNARYLYTNVAEPPLEGLRRVAGPATNAAGTIVYLYEFDGDSPFAWVAPLAIKAPDDNVLATVLDPRFDVRRAALFDTSAAVPVAAVPDALPPPSDINVRTLQYAPGRISLTLDRPAPAGSALVVSENYYPGWQATVDGRATAVGRVDYALLGVALPSGSRQVELVFTSPAFQRGKVVTVAVVGLSALAIFAGLGLMWRRRG